MALSSETLAARRRHLLEAAQALIRERGDAGFSMAQLAAHAGVSAATPYNLLGSKSEILRLVVRDDFDRFTGRLKRLRGDSPLARLLGAADLVVTHYEADRTFHRGLYRAAFTADAPKVRDATAREGRALWQGFVEAAVQKGELLDFVQPAPLTGALIRAIGSVAQSWLAERWPRKRFALEMAVSVRLTLASVASPLLRDAMTAEIAEAMEKIAGPVCGRSG